MRAIGSAAASPVESDESGLRSACRVLLVDDHRVFRDGLRALLEREKDYLVVGDTAAGNDSLELIDAAHPDVVVTDLHQGDGSSVRHLEEIHARFPNIGLLVLTAFRAHDVAARVRKAGARGYLLKDRGLREFLEALREVAAGRCYRTQADAGARARSLSAKKACVTIVDLTERQRQILRALARGYRTQETARMLGVSVRAVHKQRERIREALRLESVAALTRFAAREGFADEDAAAS